MKLLEGNHVDPVLLKNRIAFSPIATGFGVIDGCFGQSEIDFATEKAKGGAALIFTDAVATNRHRRVPSWSPPR